MMLLQEQAVALPLCDSMNAYVSRAMARTQCDAHGGAA